MVTLGGKPVMGSGSHRSGMKECEEGYMDSLKWIRGAAHDRGVRAGIV